MAATTAAQKIATPMTTFMRCQANIVFSISVLPKETRQQCPVVRLGILPYQREDAMLGQLRGWRDVRNGSGADSGIRADSGRGQTKKSGHSPLMNAFRNRASRTSIIGAAFVAVAACAQPLSPDELLVMSLEMHDRSPALMPFGYEGSERLTAVDLSEARDAFQSCGTTLSRWERLPSHSDPDAGLTHYWRCTSNDVTTIAEVYWGGSLGVEGHLGLDGVRFAACSPSRCPTQPYASFEPATGP